MGQCKFTPLKVKTSEGKSSDMKDAQGPKPDLQPEGENDTPEALLNDVVLQTIFKYLEFEDLRACRRIKNCVWLRNSNNAWWSLTKVVFKEKDDSAVKITDYLSHTEINMNVTNYKFENCSKMHERIFDTLGHFIKTLEFESCSFSSVDAFRTLVYIQCSHLEKLTVRKIHFKTVVTSHVTEPVEWETPKFGEQKNLKFLHFGNFEVKKFISWMELLSHFPNLQGLEAFERNSDIYKAILIIRQHDPNNLKLKDISIRSSIECHWIDYTEPFRQFLLDPSLSFEKLTLEFIRNQMITFARILEFHAHSLKELCIFDTNAQLWWAKVLILHSLPNLKVLDIRCLFTSDLFKYTPNVRKVSLFYDGEWKVLGEADPNLRLNLCKNLELTTDHVNPVDFKLFLNLFPNVEILEINDINNVKFSMICEHWTKLKSCTLESGEVDTFGLFGYYRVSNAANGIRNPNIANLKDLQSFLMYLSYSSGKSKSAAAVTNLENSKAIVKELEGLHHFKRFEIFKMKDDGGWKKIFPNSRTSKN